MANFSTSEFKQGLKVIIDNDPCNILENEFVKPGKGQAFNRVKYRNLVTGRTLEKTFKSGESLPGADVIEIEAQYLYDDGEFCHFMHPETFEQYQATANAVGDTKKWLKEQDSYTITLYNDQPILVSAPNFVVLKVTQTDPGLKGDTATGGSKPATLETGAIVKVPLFVNEGDLLKIDTRTGEYASRAKE